MNEHQRIIQRLADRAAERLTPAGEAELQRHLEQCEACREQARRFGRSFAALAGTFQEAEVPSLAAAVFHRVDQAAPARFEFGWRSIWAGAAVLTAVLFFSVWMVRPGLSDRQVLADYGQDMQALWEGGAVDTLSASMLETWGEPDWVERLETGETEVN
jgi:anti-sigma factor RsiW